MCETEIKCMTGLTKRVSVPAVALSDGGQEYTRCAIPPLTHHQRVIKTKENGGLFLSSFRFGN